MMKAKKNRQKKASPLFFIAVALCVSLSAGLVAYAAWLVHGNSAGNSVTIGAPTVLTIGEDNEAVFTAGDGALDGPGAELVKSVTVKISAGSAQFSLFVTRFSITGGEAEYDERDLYYQVSPDKSDGSWTARAAFIAPETDEDLDAPNPDRLYLIRNGAVSAGSPATVFLKIGLGEETGDGEHPAASLAGQTVSFTIAAGLPQQDFAPYTIGKDTMANGSVTVQSGANAGESVTVTAVPAMGYALDTLTVYKTGDAFTTVEVSDGAFTMPAYDVTVAATFKKINSAITKGAETNGTVTVVANADYGDSVTLTAVPAAGYHVASRAVYKTGDADTAGEVSGDAFT
ncbi:MAG: hypothetical protein LBL66_01900, partial [Clostridiales bacterium]|nr:hypothetical protein [Clostridiales bacterium]